jgi:hypothetical protein
MVAIRDGELKLLLPFLGWNKKYSFLTSYCSERKHSCLQDKWIV